MNSVLRSASPSDQIELGRMGAALARQHHAYDALRFMFPDDIEAGYRWWLAKESARDGAVVLVAELAGKIAGYAYGGVEERDWALLLDRAGWFHDLWVEPFARGKGVGRQLAEAMSARLKDLGVPRVVLTTATRNEPAQRLFASLGFRTTMLEMTREL